MAINKSYPEIPEDIKLKDYANEIRFVMLEAKKLSDKNKILEAEVLKFKLSYENCLKSLNTEREVTSFLFSRVQVLEAERNPKPQPKEKLLLRIVR